MSFAQFDILWQRSAYSSSLPTWFSSTGSTERGLAYGNVGGNERVYVVSRNGGNSVRIINATDGSDIGTLDLGSGIISGGTFAINDVEVSDDGLIFVCNLTINASTSAFKVYKWTSEGGTPTEVINYNGLAVRLGDKFTVVGSASDNSLTIWAGATTGTTHVRFTTTDNGATFTATTFTGPSGGTSVSFGPLATGVSDYYFNYSGINPSKYQSNNILIGTIPGSIISIGSNAIRYLGEVDGIEYVAAYTYGGGNENARVAQVPNNTPSSATLFGVTPQLGGNSNGNGSGDLDFKDNGDGTYTVFVLGTNNGFGAYKTSQGTLDWVNLQSPASATITSVQSLDVYAQVYKDGVTNATGQGAGITAWIGYSTSNTNPNTWTNWIPAVYNTDVGNNDEYKATLSGLPVGTYYYASRFRNYLGQFYYGGYSAGGGGFWDGTNYVSGVLTVTAPPTTIDWANLQSPASGSIFTNQTFDVYAQVYINGVTDPAGQASGVQAWIGYSTTNTNPNTWTNWVAASYNTDVGNNDEYMATLSGLSAGTYYYASRFNYNGGSYYYGGYSAGGGGFWDGTNYVSGQLTVTEANTVIDWANLQSPPSASISPAGKIDVYAQIYVDGVTNAAGQGAGIDAWIGYSTSDTDPSTWTNWIPASFNTDVGNNDEYTATLTGLYTGTYYYASRFQRNGGAYYYGGYSAGGGGFWNGTTYVSGVATVSSLSGTYYIGNAGTKPGGGDPDFLSLKTACNAVNYSTISGDITFYFTSDLTESSNVGLGKDPGSYTVTFKPYSGLTPTITFTQTADNTGASGAWVIGVPDLTVTTATNYGLVTTNNIIIDGSNTTESATRDLTIQTLSGISGSTYPIRIFGDANNITIKNCNVTANNSTSYAVLLTNRNFSSVNYVPDNVTIENCAITNTVGNTGQGLAISNSGSPTAFPTGIVFKDNLINARTRGIFLNYAGDTDIYGNEIHVNQTSTGYLSYGIWAYILGAGSNVNIYNNKILELKSANANSGSYGINGIYINSNGNYNVYNNFITGFEWTGTTTINGIWYGIGVATSSASISANIYHNTVVCNDMFTTGTAGTLNYAAFYVNVYGTGETRIVNAKNNIFINLENDFVNYAYIWSNTSGVTLTSEYNDLYVGDATNGKIGKFGATDCATLALWQSTAGKDLSSVSQAVNFVSATDLHLSGASVGDGNLASAFVGITTDLDGDTRNAYWPYMGADEVTSSPLALKLTLKTLIEGYWGNGGLQDTIKVRLANPISFAKSVPVLGMSSATGVDFYLPKGTSSTHWIVVNHRNTIETWSASDISFPSGVASYDFTDASTKAYGDNLKFVSGKWCMFSGDIPLPSQDGLIDLTDVIAIINDANAFAFGTSLLTDLNGDDAADLSDIVIAVNNANLFVSKITPEPKSNVSKPVELEKVNINIE